MPTKRIFDLVILTVLLSKPVFGLVHMVATRRAIDPDQSPLTATLAGAAKLAS